MKRQLLVLCALAAVVVGVAGSSVEAAGGIGGRGGIRTGQARGFGHGLGFGLGVGGIGGGYSDIFGYAELYRELYNNLPYFALHPPVYYSEPVPRTYGYSPFAYPGYIMTPEIAAPAQPVTIINPHVKSGNEKAATPASDKATSTSTQVQPLVVTNPFVVPKTVAQTK